MQSRFEVTITEKGGETSLRVFEQPEVTIGRVQGNDIVLPKGNISKRHSRIVLRDGKFIIVDLKSTNGTYVNGRRISSPQVLKSVDKIYIGDYTLTVATPGDAAADSSISMPEESSSSGGEVEPDDERPIDDDNDEDLEQEPQFTPPPAAMKPAADLPASPVVSGAIPKRPEPSVREALGREASVREASVREASVREPSVREAAVDAASSRPAPARREQAAPVAVRNGPSPVERALRSRVYRAARDAAMEGGNRDSALKAAVQLQESLQREAPGVDLSGLEGRVADEVNGADPLRALLADTTIEELFINGPHRLLARTAGSLRVLDEEFSCAEALSDAIARLLEDVGMAFDERHPVVDTRLSSGQIVQAIHESAAVDGPVFTASRVSSVQQTLADLLSDGVLSPAMGELLETCVRARRNVLVCSGASTALAQVVTALVGALPDERIVAVHQGTPIPLPQSQAVSLDAHGAARMGELVGVALRMRPSRLVVHELRGSEALEVVLALGGSQDGAMLSTYASSARGALERIETMMAMAARDVPPRALRAALSAAVDIIVVVSRFADGQIRITEIVEVTGTEVDLVTTQEIFRFERHAEGRGGDGRFVVCDRPRFYDELKARGEVVNMAIFREV